MRGRRAPHIPQRLRILLSCEGQSERAYGIWLNKRAREAGLHIHVEAKICRPPGGGDLLSLVEDTEKEIVRAQQMRVPYVVKGLLLDEDMRNRSRERDNKAQVIAKKHDLHLIWQVCDHEAFLLRHLPGCHNHNPPRGHSTMALCREIRTYKKPLVATDLEKIIDIAALQRVVAVERELREFLRAMQWSP